MACQMRYAVAVGAANAPGNKKPQHDTHVNGQLVFIWAKDNPESLAACGLFLFYRRLGRVQILDVVAQGRKVCFVFAYQVIEFLPICYLHVWPFLCRPAHNL